jgi:hypothetical protein
MGIWPWSDVFKSSEMGNMIVSVLSAGAVGTGDSIGKENKANIMMACRNDGVIVKPDAPLLPIDQNYIDIARHAQTPVVACTYTQHNNIKTAYVFAFLGDSSKLNQFGFSLHDIGMRGKVVVYSPLQHTVQLMEEGGRFNTDLPEDKFAYYIVAPITGSGIAFLGDAGKITATGKKRIESISDAAGKLQVKVLFAKGEAAVTLQGYAVQNVSTDKGKLSQDRVSHLFTLVVPAPLQGNITTITLQAR